MVLSSEYANIHTKTHPQLSSVSYCGCDRNWAVPVLPGSPEFVDTTNVGYKARGDGILTEGCISRLTIVRISLDIPINSHLRKLMRVPCTSHPTIAYRVQNSIGLTYFTYRLSTESAPKADRPNLSFHDILDNLTSTSLLTVIYCLYLPI